MILLVTHNSPGTAITELLTVLILLPLTMPHVRFSSYTPSMVSLPSMALLGNLLIPVWKEVLLVNWTMCRVEAKSQWLLSLFQMVIMFTMSLLALSMCPWDCECLGFLCNLATSPAVQRSPKCRGIRLFKLAVKLCLFFFFKHNNFTNII